MIEAEMRIQLEFDSGKKAQMIYNALKQEFASAPSDRTLAEFICHENKISLNIKAADSASLRAAVNSYLRWIMVSESLMEKRRN